VATGAPGSAGAQNRDTERGVTPQLRESLARFILDNL
jgi:hypothetical protein